MRIAGIDVSRGSITMAILDRAPDRELKEFIKSCKIYKFPKRGQPIGEAIDELLALPFDGAVLEPTGTHYSKLWAEKIKASGREVKWVGHQEIAGYRKAWRLPDKTDKTDAVAIACYGIERWNIAGMFLDPRMETANQLRNYYLQIQFHNTATTPLINRLRQQLSWELPELSQHKASREWLAQPSGLWKAIAGDPKPKWSKIIDSSCGLGIGSFSRELAQQIVQSELALLRIETEIEALLKLPEFDRYLAAMQPFYFGRRTATALLANIYPFEKFAKRSNPLGAFKMSCGMAQIWHESGDFKGWIPGGDVECRKALWLWSFVTIPQQRVVSPELAALRDYYQNGSEQMVKNLDTGEMELKHFEAGKGSQRLMRTARRALTMLYRKIRDSSLNVKSINH